MVQQEMTVPTVELLLRLLVEAGDNGMDIGTIVRRFSFPPHVPARNARINEILRRQARRGNTRRSENKEPSVHYHNTPQYRWFITDQGRAWVEAGFQTAERRRSTARKISRQHGRALLAEALAKYNGSSRGVSRTERQRVLRELRQYDVPLRACGSVFGISGEMVRHVLARGYKVRDRRPADAEWVEQFRTAVRDQLRDAAVSQRELAAALGVSPNQVSYMLTGGINTTLELMTRVADAAGLKITAEKNGNGILGTLGARAWEGTSEDDG